MRLLPFIMILLFFGCESEITNQVPVKMEAKKVVFEFFTDKDLSADEFDDHFVKLRVRVTSSKKKSTLETPLFDESTEWIAFKDIPEISQKLTIEKDLGEININDLNLNAGYWYETKIGNTVQSKASSEAIGRGETVKIVQIKF